MKETALTLESIKNEYIDTTETAQVMHVKKRTLDWMAWAGRLDSVRTLYISRRKFYHKQDLLDLIIAAQKYKHKWCGIKPAIPIQERKKMRDTGSNVFKSPRPKETKQASPQAVKAYFDKFRL